MVKKIDGKIHDLNKGFDFTHGYGYFCQITHNHIIGFGFSKNKFKCVRIAKKQLQIGIRLKGWHK